jgi:flagellar protein FliO/FliZ
MPKTPAVTLATLLLAWASGPALAAPAAATTSSPPSFFGELMSIVLPLAFIILVLLAALHFARRRYGLTAPDAPLSVVQILPLGPRERIVLVKTRGGRVFAVGVSSQSVHLITDLDPAELASTTAPVEAGTPRRAPTLFGLPLNLRDPERRGNPRPPS